MGIQRQHIISGAAAVAVLLGATPAAFAQEVQTVSDAFNELFSTSSEDFYTERRPFNQAAALVGLGGFTEQRTARDAEAINAAYQNLLQLQTTLDPTLRVPDLANPYTSSLLLTPSFQSTSGAVGSEFIFETLPAR